MAARQDELIIRSYRLCFALERRIFRVDRWRIPAPYGVPLSGLAYAALALMAILLLERLPVTGEMLGVLHPALRLVILPVGVAYAACRLCVDGRPAHAAALAWLRWRIRAERVVAFRRARADRVEVLHDVVAPVDGLEARYRRCVVRGPAQVTLRYPARARGRGRKVELEQADGAPLWRGKVIRLNRRQLVRLR
jgi:hypothetical protein